MHCLSGAALAGAPGLGRIFADERVERALVGVAAIIALAALTAGYKRHRSLFPVALGAVGAVTLASAGLELGFESAEVLLSVAGAALLIGAHWVNLRLQRTCGFSRA